MDWQKVECPICHEKRKNTKKNKVFFNLDLSNKQKRKMVFHCTNHEHFIMFTIQIFTVKDVIVSVRQFVFQDRIPKT